MNEDLELFFPKISDTDREQLRTLLEAFEKFKERNAKYRDLWKDGGWTDSAHHIRHKAARIANLLNGVASLSDAAELIDEAIDLINFSVFFIRNVRLAQAGQGRIIPVSAPMKATRDIAAGEEFRVDLSTGEVVDGSG